MNTDKQEKLRFEAIESEFNACFFPHEQVERLWSGGRWCEGPAWFPAWIDYKRSNEIEPLRLRPHPYEFQLYYDI